MTKKLKVVISISAIMAIMCCVIAIICVMLSKPKSTGLSIAVDEMSMQVDEVKPITYKCSDSEATITFVIEDEEIVTLQDGLIYAKQAGSTTLRATATKGNDRAVTTTKISVLENPNGPITDLPSKITLFLLDKEIDKAREDGYDNQKSFNSFKDYSLTLEGNSVKVSKNTITASKLGTTIITFSSQDQKQTVEVDVLSILPSIELPDKITLSKDETYEIKPKITPSYYTGQVQLTIEEEGNNLSIDNLTITAKQSGTSKLLVYLNDVLVKKIEVIVDYKQEVNLSFNSNAELKDGTIYVKDDILMFETNVKNEEPKLFTSEGKIYKELTMIVLENFTNATITIIYPNLNVYLSYSVVKV